MRDRWVLVGMLRTESPLLVGGLLPRSDLDRTMVRDGLDRWIIPGTSLAGALRHALTGSSSAGLWGSTEMASRIVVDDCAALTANQGPGPLDPSPAPEARERVGLNPATGVAEPGALFNHELVPAGTCFTLRITLDVPAGPPAPGEQPPAALEEVAALLQAGLQVGAGDTVGLGRVVMPDGFSVHRQDFTSRAAALASLHALAQGRDGTVVPLQSSVLAPVQDRVTVTAHFDTLLPLAMMRRQRDAAADLVPRVVPAGPDRVRLVLHGSSVKGVLRHHALRLFDQDVVDPVFGTGSRRGALSTQDCHSTTTVDPRAWESLVSASREAAPVMLAAANDDLRRQAEAPGTLAWLRLADHIAIDRWTGGASDGPLFTVLEPHDFDWEPMRWSLDLHRLEPEQREAAVGLVRTLCSELERGWLRFGAMTNRGMGMIRTTSVRIDSSDGAGWEPLPREQVRA